MPKNTKPTTQSRGRGKTSAQEKDASKGHIKEENSEVQLLRLTTKQIIGMACHSLMQMEHPEQVTTWIVCGKTGMDIQDIEVPIKHIPDQATQTYLMGRLMGYQSAHLIGEVQDVYQIVLSSMSGVEKGREDQSEENPNSNGQVLIRRYVVRTKALEFKLFEKVQSKIELVYESKKLPDLRGNHAPDFKIFLEKFMNPSGIDEKESGSG